MTPFYFVVASLPFALYFLALAWLHGRRRPTLVTGRRDGLAVALATVGVLFIGPLQILRERVDSRRALFYAYFDRVSCEAATAIRRLQHDARRFA